MKDGQAGAENGHKREGIWKVSLTERLNLVGAAFGANHFEERSPTADVQQPGASSQSRFVPYPLWTIATRKWNFEKAFVPVVQRIERGFPKP